ncbi:MAG: AIPR family protein [Candidatus Eisenbacteria bacterium]|nr:AIPR family protein [Candidatus Eisenbacteria bacterium]
MAATTHLTFPVVSFRHLETPFQPKGFRDYFAIVEVKNLPDLTDWRKINVRDPKLTGSVPRAIRDSLHANTETFLFLNRGLVISAADVSFDNRSGKLSLVMEDPNLHGLMDGGHTYKILIEEQEGLEGTQYVRLEIIQGFTKDDIRDLVDARNTSNQVRDESLMNLAGEFDKLKRAVSRHQYAELIAYKEHEIMEDGGTKPIDIREIISLLMVFDREHFDAATHPINAYRSKAASLNHFGQNRRSFEKIYPLANDILQLWDHIHLQLPELYNRARGKGEDVSGGKFGKLTGVAMYEGKRREPLYFVKGDSKYSIPTGFKYPILGAFRAILEESDGRYVWGKGLDPKVLLMSGLGETLAGIVGNFALDQRNPSKTGKSALVWQSCYQAAELVYLRSKAAK